MGFNQDINMILGGLAHGMDVDQAFGLYQQALANRQEMKAQRGSQLSDLVQQGVSMGMEEGADPEQVLQAVTAIGQSMGMKPKMLNTGLSTLTGTEQAPGLLSGAGGGWDEEDDAAFFSTEPGGPMEYMNTLFTNPRLLGADGLPDRSKIRQEMMVRFGPDAASMPGFNAAVDRGYQSLLNTSSTITNTSSTITPEEYGAYEQKLQDAGRTSSTGGQEALGEANDYGVPPALGLAATGAGLLGAGALGAYGKQGWNYAGSKLPGTAGQNYAAKLAFGKQHPPLLARGISKVLGSSGRPATLIRGVGKGAGALGAGYEASNLANYAADELEGDVQGPLGLSVNSDPGFGSQLSTGISNVLRANPLTAVPMQSQQLAEDYIVNPLSRLLFGGS